MSHLKPSCTPRTRKPSLTASMAAAEMTALMPGAGPPPTMIARTSLFAMNDWERSLEFFWKDDFTEARPIIKSLSADALEVLLRQRRARRLLLPEGAHDP